MPMVRGRGHQGPQRLSARATGPAPPGTTRLSPKAIAIVAFQAGFGKELAQRGESFMEYVNPFVEPEKQVALGNVIELRNAVAIALAESRGRVAAKGGPNVDGSYDLGLWQINTAAHVDKGFRFDEERLLADPQYNANAAFKVYEEREARGVNGFEAWSAFRNKSYTVQLQRARRGLQAAGFFEPEFKVPDGGNWASEINLNPMSLLAGALDGFAEKLWPVLLKTAVAGTGLALIGYGVKGLFGSSSAEVVQKTAPVATAVAKGGTT